MITSYHYEIILEKDVGGTLKLTSDEHETPQIAANRAIEMYNHINKDYAVSLIEIRIYQR